MEIQKHQTTQQLSRMPLTSLQVGALRPKSISECLKSSYGTLQKLSNEQGPEAVQVVLIGLISDLNAFFNLPRPMNGMQIAQTAELILDCYPNYTPEDIVRCFRNIKTLKYGKLFEGLDGGKILDFFASYDLDRENEIVDLRRSEAAKHKEASKMPAEILGPLLEKFKKDEAKPKLQKSPEDQQIQDFYREFDLLHRNHPVKIGGFEVFPRLVEYRGQKCDSQTFVVIKLNEAREQKTA